MRHTLPKTGLLPLRRAVFFFSTTVLLVIIAILTLGPVTALNTIPGNDKIHHLTGFAALLVPCAFLYGRALYYILPGSILFGGMIELLQPYVNRNGEWADFGADAIGAMLGSAIGLALRYFFRTRKRVQDLAG